MRRLAQVGLALTTMMVLLVGCNPYNKMQKNVGKIDAYATPEVLALKGQTVEADITYTFPKKYFYEEMILKVTPVLVFEGGEVAGTPKYFQGEDVRDNYTPVSWKNGGVFTQKVVFPYDERANLSTLVLRVEGRTADQCRRDKFKTFGDFGSVVVAQGISTVQSLADMPYMILMDHNFKRVRTVTGEADIHYQINSPVVRKNQLSLEQVKLFEAFVRENSAAEDVTMGTVYAKGYASPDGPENFNQKLSAERSKSGEKAIKENLKGIDVQYDAAAYGEDWEGFRELVAASDIADKDLILQVLSMYDSSARREQEIKNLSAVYNELKTKILPELRRTQLVASADVVGLSDEEIVAAIQSKDGSLRLDEILYGATLINDPAKKIAAYRMAAEKYNDVAAYNNLAVALMMNGDVAGAKQTIDKAARINGNPTVTNNLAAVAIAQGDLESAKKYLSALNSKEAQMNKGLVALQEGDYVVATRDLEGYNLAVVEVLNGNYANAKQALGNCKCADSEYLRAIIAMREGDSQGAISYLRNAIALKPSLREAAKTDVEFARLFNSPEFQAL